MKTLLPEIDSADKRFHNGNPATGEQGTRVTDTWLNDVQDRVRDVQAEAHYVLQKAGFKPISNKTTQLYEAIIKIISDNRNTASTTQSGEVELSSEVNSNAENKAATPKAVKTAFDRAVTAETNNRYQKIYVSNGALTLDLTNKQQIIDLFGESYRNNGHLSFTAHNNAQSNITGLPLTTKSPIAVTFYLIGGYSSVYCHYPILGRSFFSSVNFNNTVLTYKWIELITNTGEQTINHQLNIKTGGWGKLFFPIDNGGTWRFEINPDSEKEPRFNVVYKMKDNSTRYCSFPLLEKNEVVAYRSWADARIADNFTRGKLTTQNLNDVKAYGVYAQEANKDATTERNYPTNFAGTLLVYPSAYNVMQQYINFRTGETYQRNQNIDLRTWSDWRRVDGLNAVSKSGDAMTGALQIKGVAPGGFANGLQIKNLAGGQGTSGYVDFYQSESVPRASIWMRDAGKSSTQFEFLTTPEGADFNKDQRQNALTIASTGAIWSKQYGWLHDFFAKQSDNNNIWDQINNHLMRRSDFIRTYYPTHYAGTEVYKIRHLGLMITVMNLGTGNAGEYFVPESYDGHNLAWVTDNGGSRGVGISGVYDGNKIRLHGGNTISRSVLVVGFKNV